MKKGHCQDGKNTSAPFYLFPQHWDWGERLNCMKKDCVCERERVYVKVCVQETKTYRQECNIPECLWVRHLKETSLWILKSYAWRQRSTITAMPQAQINIKGLCRATSVTKLYDMSFPTFIFMILPLILSAPYLCCFLFQFKATVGCANSKCSEKYTKHLGLAGSLPAAQGRAMSEKAIKPIFMV